MSNKEVKNRIKHHLSGLSFRIISTIVVVLLLFGALQCLTGYIQFTRSFTKEYNDSAFRTAETAAILVNGDNIREYLDTLGDSDEYRQMAHRLDMLCQKQNVTLIYIIDVDRSDYGRFTTVISAANKNSDYDPWTIGYQRDTTNDEYRAIYRDIYENGLERGSLVRTNNLRGYEPHITSLIPVKNKDGEVTAILCVQRPMGELKEGRHKFVLRMSVLTVLLVLFTALSAFLFLRRHFVLPMKKVTKEAERFARENTIAVEGALKNLSSIREIDTLARSLDRMERDTLLYIEKLTAMTSENERIGTELALARGIQAAILPSEFPPFPWKHEFEIYASMSPAKEVGGDFYDFFLVDEDHLGMVIADVAGKGVPAALFMMVAKLLIKLRARSGGDPGQMLSDVSGTLCEKNKAGLFVTVWLAILELSTGKGRVMNAGHEYPALCHKDGRYEMIVKKHAPPLATVEGIKYEDHEFKLEPGDTIFVYTDGVTEAMNGQKDMFGNDRLLEALNKDPSADPQTLLSNVRSEIDAFVGDAQQFDDITMLSFRYNGCKNN